ncbi:MAG TPA: hypothetical protein VK553_00165, partial [Candidatus Nitrosopolaris rasttigaisensis]|nr:hypothetical protein [Candidatus Nitrosopolaris rasttigaisensis]
RAIQTALEQADTLSQPDFTHALQTAITTPWDSEEAIKGAYKQFVEEHLMNKQYACIGHIYRDSLKALKAYDSAFEELDLLKKRLKSYHREDLPNAKAYQCTPSEVQEFEEKLKAFISAHIESKRIKKTKIRTKKSIIDYYNSLAKKPLQEKQSLNEAEVVSAQEGLLHLQPKIQDYKEQKATLEREIQEIAGGDPHYTKIAPNQLPKQLHDLAQQQSKLQGEIESLTTQLEATRHQQTLEARPKNPDRPLDESKLSEASLKALENDKVRRFTNSLARIYKSKYGEQFDPNQAVDSVLFLCRQGVLFDKPARYIEIAADLLHEFGASLMDFHFDRQTSQIKIKPELSEMKDLEPLRLTRHGVLRIGEQKLKSSVLASVGNTHTWIFSIRKRYAYNHELFAGDTPMQQSGGVDFEDLGKLKKDNKVDIFAIAIEREFREEAQGYELIPNTIQKDDQEVDPNTSTDHVVFFRAEAQQLSGPVPLFSPQSRETRGTFLVDIPEFIKKYQIDQCDFSDETDKTDHSKVMEAMLSEASKRKCITYPKEGEPRRHQFMTMSYNVKHTVDSIVKIVKAEREKEISWEFNPDKIGSGSNS